MKAFRPLLAPFALIYGLGVSFRNWLFSLGILKEKSFDLPVITIGNISTGGTGKSPHVEYLIELLKDHFHVATLSRGYGRRTSGFQIVESDSPTFNVGDEPKQFKCNYPDVTVAVDGNRRHGIKLLQKKSYDLTAILLDDAFQHRYVKAGLNILLTDYAKLYVHDNLLPVGNLREWRSASKRADIIVVTKTPQVLSPLDRRIIDDDLRLSKHQKLYFSYLEYGEVVPIHPVRKPKEEEHYYENDYSILLVTGIAKPSMLFYRVNQKVTNLRHLRFADHHPYSIMDFRKIKKEFDALEGDRKIILTTQKDAMRMLIPGLQEEIKDLPLFYIPIKVRFHEEDEEEFNKRVTDYVGGTEGND